MKYFILSLLALSAELQCHVNAFSASPSNPRTSQLNSAVVEDDDTWQGEEEKLPVYSKSIPFLRRPKFLDGSLAGDVSFDPLGFATSKDQLIEYREAEIKHSRLAMLAAVGWPISELLDPTIASKLDLEPVLDVNNRVPSLFNGGLEKVSPVWWGFCLGLTAAIDMYGVQRARTLPPSKYSPGDLNFDPLGLYPKDPEGRKEMQLAEIKHGRAAMIAVTAFAVQEYVSSIGIIDETPLFFRPLSTVESVLETIANSSV